MAELVERFGDKIPASEFPPYWRRVLPELLESYNRICSYLCLRISGGTGAPSVDHMVAKSVRRDLVYEWHNYRLACSLMNSRKGTDSDVVDPFEVGVFRRICGQNGEPVGQRQTHSVRVCSPPSRRVAPLRPGCAGLTAWTPAPRSGSRLLWFSRERCRWVEVGPRDERIRPSLRSERVYHARSVPAVNPLRGSSAALRSFG